MRPVFGMMKADRPILRLFADCEVALKLTSVLYNLETRYDIEISESTLYRRLNTLQYAGLLEKEDVETSHYYITELGERMLDEDLTDDEVAEISQKLQEGPQD